MKPPTLRVLSSTKSSVFLTWSNQPPLSSSGSSSSLLKTRPSRSSLTSEDRKVSRTSLASSDIAAARKSLRTPKDSIEDLLDSPTESESQIKEWFTLQQSDRLLGWITVYWGFKNKKEILPLAPGEVHQFRIKRFNEDENSDWSEVLTTATKDDVVSANGLHRALDQGHMTSARKVLSLRIAALEIPNKLGRTPLGMATVRGDTNICSMLLTCGADVTAGESASGRTPLMMASFIGATDLIHVLTERDASWLDRDRFGQTPLHYSVLSCKTTAVQLACKEKLSINIKDKNCWTPLMLAVISNSPENVIEILLRHGADINICDKRKQTVLMQAVLAGSSKTVQLLLKLGVDYKIRNCYGHSAYDIAVNSQNQEIIDQFAIMKNKSETISEIVPNKRKASQVVRL